MCSCAASGLYKRQKCFRFQSVPTKPTEMKPALVRLFAYCAVAMILATWFVGSEATYRKPPFNGSIFGKRGATIEYDNTGKALSAMCEIATEACQAWFPTQEK